MTLLLAEKVRQFTCYWRTIHVMLGLQSRDHAKKGKENTSWSQATFVYFRAIPPRHLTPALVACRCRPPPLRVVAPSADYEYLMFLGARRSCGQFIIIQLCCQVEIFNVEAHIFCAFCAEHAVPQQLRSSEIGRTCRRAAFVRY